VGAAGARLGQVCGDCAGKRKVVVLLLKRSDVVCEYPMRAMMEQHLKTGAEATILVTKVSAGYRAVGHDC
jgi:ADP-glucose pyrophosphorylase